MRIVSEHRRQKEMRQRVWDRDGWHCWYCGQPIAPAKYGVPNRAVVDHQIPLSQGGEDNDANLVAACNACNAKKGAKTVVEYRRHLATSHPAGQAIEHIDAIFRLMESTPFDFMLAHCRRWLGQQQPDIVFFGERVDMSTLERQKLKPAYPESARRLRGFAYSRGSRAIHAIDDFGRGMCTAYREDLHTILDDNPTCSHCLSAIDFAERNGGLNRGGLLVLRVEASNA
jgi:hypothetical protein